MSRYANRVCAPRPTGHRVRARAPDASEEEGEMMETWEALFASIRNMSELLYNFS